MVDEPRSAPELAFLAMDRRFALAAGAPLPARTRGAVLFADVAGFTPTSERLVATLGPSRGAEALTQILDAVYTALIAEVHARRGSVINFAGDAITCLFTDDDGRRALACGLAMHPALAAIHKREPLRGWRFALDLKVAVSVGELQRLVGGDPALQSLDLLAGPPIHAAAALERLLRPGETACSPALAAALDLVLRQPQGPGDDAPAIVLRLGTPVPLDPWPPTPDLDPALVRPWLLRHVRQHMSLGAGSFLGELRQCTVVFVRLPAPADAAPEADFAAAVAPWIARAQTLIDHHGGVLAQVVLGDKGGYLYAVFGAPVAHEDDAARAVAAAWALARGEPGRSAPAIGISQGRTYAGAYGSPMRRTYGLLGVEVNTAARLMSEAPAGTLLLTERVAAEAPDFRSAAFATLALRGLARPLPILRVVGRAARRRQLPRRALVVGRAREQALLADQLADLVRGESGVVVVEGEPGIGKSRLLADLVDHAEAAGVTTIVGFAEALEATTPYHAWRAPLSELLAVGPRGEPSPAILAALADPAIAPLLPLLATILPLQLADTPQTAPLIAEGRANLAHTVVARLCARELAGRPLLLILEDAQWLDSASWALTLLLRFELAPLLLVLATRPIAASEPAPLRQLLGDPATRHLRLAPLAPADVLTLVGHRLGVDELPDELAAFIRERAGGHPFFSEELALALRDAGVLVIEGRRARLVPDAAALRGLDFPTTIRGVIAGRVDLLAPAEQLTLKVASVVGPVFTDLILRSVYPIDAEPRAIADHLSAFTALDLTIPLPPAPDPRHSFRHAVTHEVVYDLLLASQRARLHRAIATWLEGQLRPEADASALLAHHWERAGEPTRARAYLLVSGERALALGAYQEAIAAFERALALEPADLPQDQRAAQRIGLGDVLWRVGRLTDARRLLLAGLALAGAPCPATPRALAADLARLTARQLARRLRHWGGDPPPNLHPPTALDLAIARAHHALSMIAYTLNDRLATVHAALTRIERVEQTDPDPGQRLRAYASLTVITSAVRQDRLTAEYARLAATQLPLADPTTAAAARQMLAVTALGAGRIAEAESLYLQVQQDSAASGELRMWEEVTAGLGHCLRHRGAWADADLVFESLIQRALRQGDAQARGWGLANRAYLAMRRGDLASARALVDLGAALRPHSADAIGEAKRLCAAVFTALRSGDHPGAARAAADLDPLIQRAPIAYNMLHAYLAAAEYSLAADFPSAALAVDRLARYARVFPIAKAHAALVRARWLAASQAPARQVHAALTLALTAARRVGLPHCEAEAHRLLAALIPGPDDERREHLAAARALFTRLGAAWDLAHLDER